MEEIQEQSLIVSTANWVSMVAEVARIRVFSERAEERRQTPRVRVGLAQRPSFNSPLKAQEGLDMLD